MSYRQISTHERYMIFKLLQRGFSIRYMGRLLDRSPSTISREIRRNRGPVRDLYWYETANDYAIQRRSDAPRENMCDNTRVYGYLIEKLKDGWSPELIAGRMVIEYPYDPVMRVSHETIYRWIYKDANSGGNIYSYLVRRRKKRKKQRKEFSLRGQIPGRVGIECRPCIVEERSRIGDWESDTIAGARAKGGVATHVERKSRYLIAAKLDDKRSKTYTDATLAAFKYIPKEKLHTMTADNGSEFYDFKRIEKKLRLSVYFADPYSSWQRGTNENTNGLLRRYFPKRTDFTGIDQITIANVVEKLNNRPRKCLKYQTPQEVFFEKPPVALRM